MVQSKYYGEILEDLDEKDSLAKYKEYLYLVGGNGVKSRILIFKFNNGNGLIIEVRNIGSMKNFTVLAKPIRFVNDYLWDEMPLREIHHITYKRYSDIDKLLEEAIFYDKQFLLIKKGE